MPSQTRTIETDVCIVGAGLLGLAHALEARRRGLSVVLLDRGSRAAGASVRGSGHLFFSALEAGHALDSAQMARERWRELAEQAGTAAEQTGTLIIARNDHELAVLEAAAAESGRQARIRSAKKVGRLVPIPVDQIVGGFHAKGDMRVGPRSAPAAFARLLHHDPCARIEWAAHVHAIEPGIVHAGQLRVRAEAIVVCPGAEYRALPVEVRPARADLTLRETQMLRLAAPGGRRYRQTLATALTLLEHPGFSAQDGTAKLRERLELESPQLIERGVSLALTQLADGDLMLGSTNTYTDAPTAYSREHLDDLLLLQAQLMLGLEPRVKQRWSSVQPCATDSGENFLTTRPMAGVRVVLGTRPTAVALCHVHAGEVLEELYSGPPATDMYITVRDLRVDTNTLGGLRDHPGAFGPHRSRRS